MTLAFQFLGPPQLSLENEPINVNRRSIVALLSYLAVNDSGQAKRLYTRESLSALLWPDYDQVKAFTNLRHTLWEIQKTLGTGWLVADRETIGLHVDADVWVDVHNFESLLSESQIQNDVSLRLPLLTECVKLYRHHFLTGFTLKNAPTFDEWALTKADELRHKLKKALTTLTEDYCLLGNAESALQYARRLVTLDQLNESAHRLLMQVYSQVGQHNAALKQYQAFEQILRNELGLDPQPETRALYKQIRKGDIKHLEVGIRRETKNSLNNLPQQLTSFIGREQQQIEIVNLIGRNRLVTLTGSGGVGKTRLSLQVAAKLKDHYPDGVWFIELTPLTNPDLIPQTILSALRLGEQAGKTPLKILEEQLGNKKLLLILDNCEHLIAASARVAYTLLMSAPEIRILATSREALGVSGEVSWLVPSLSLPDSKSQMTFEKLTQYESIRLFIERALLVQPHFKVDQTSVLAIAQICSRLDGIPLAIELAAARVNALSVKQIARRLDDRFRLLTRGSRTVLERHQTLRAAIDWSYHLLDADEKKLLARLSVFMGGWTLEAAEQVCVRRRSEFDVLDVLSDLIDKSLVIMDASTDEARYHFLETTRQYANEKLARAGRIEAFRDKHLEYFLNLAETADPLLQRAEQIEWLKRLDAEHDNLRAALAWAMNKPSAEPVLRMAGSLGIFWGMRSHWLEGAKWLDQALGRAWNENSKAEQVARAKALYRRHDSAEALDELDIMKTSAESALALYEKLEDPWGIALTRALIANHQRHLRVFEATTIRASLEQSLHALHSLGDAAAEARLLGWLAMLSLKTGTREEFLEFIQRALARARASGDRIQIGLSLTGLAIGLMRYGQWEQPETLLQEAEQLYAEIDSPNVMEVHRLHAQFFFVHGNLEKAKVEAKRALEYCDRLGERSMQSNTFAVLALIAEAENDLQGATAYAQKALELSREMGITSYVAFDLLLIGLFNYRQGNIKIATQYVRDSLEFVRRGQLKTVELLNILDYLAGPFIEKKTQTAVQILAFSESLAQSSAVRRDSVFDKPYYDRFLAAARAYLSEAEFTSAWKVGLKMSLNGALDLALKTIVEM